MKHKLITILRIVILLVTVCICLYVGGWILLIKPFFMLYLAYISNCMTGLLILGLVIRVLMALPITIIIAWSGYIVQEILGEYGE